MEPPVTRSFAIQILILAIFAAGPCIADTEQRESIKRLIAPLVEDELISGSLLVFSKGDLVVSEAFGFAEQETVAQNSASTRFRIASVSKSLTAAAVLQLVEKGRLGLDDPLDKWLPGFKNGGDITIEQLLAHRSGIPSDVYLPDFAEKSVSGLTLNEAVSWVRDAAPRFEPGTRFEYSNSGYLILSAIIEKACAEPFDAVLSRQIFDPAGMVNSGLDTPATSGYHATGYSRSGSGEVVETAYRHPSFGWGYGALYASTSDLLSFARALFDGKLLSSTMIKKMTTGQSSTPWKNQYGLGWFVDDVGGHDMFEAIGSTGGFVATIRYFPQDDTYVVVALNRDFLLYDRLFDELSRVALGEPWRPILETQQVWGKTSIAAYAGDYKMDDGVMLRLAASKSSLLFGEPGSGQLFDVIPLSEDEGFVADLNALLRFRKSENGETELHALFGNYAWTGVRQ